MRILVADDEKEIVDVIRKKLIRNGYSVDIAYDGARALEFIKLNRYDLIFVDHDMPELTGLELVKYVKENQLNAKIVMVTGYREISDFAAKQVGADEFITKPFEIKDVERVINKYKSERGSSMSKKILIVDDEQEFLKLLKIRLESEGYKVVTASNGKEGMEGVEKESPDLIVLDIMMPVQDGYTTLRLLNARYLSMNKHLPPVIVLTAKDKMKDLFAVEGIKDYVVKPFESEDLLNRIRKLLGKEVPERDC